MFATSCMDFAASFTAFAISDTSVCTGVAALLAEAPIGMRPLPFEPAAPILRGERLRGVAGTRCARCSLWLATFACVGRGFQR